MSIYDIKIAKELRKNKIFENDREILSKRIIEIAEQIVKHGGYKNAWVGLGRMLAVNIVVTDGYMQEKVSVGKDLEINAIKHYTTHNTFTKITAYPPYTEKEEDK